MSDTIKNGDSAKDIWVFAEYNDYEIENITWEIISEGKKLAVKLGCNICLCLIGYKLKDHIDVFLKSGLDKVYFVDNKILSEYSLESYTYILEKLLEKYKPFMIMIGATPIGIELGPKLAAKLRLPCITEAKKFVVEGRGMEIHKYGYNDKAFLNYNIKSNDTIVTTISPNDTDIEIIKCDGIVNFIEEDISINKDIVKTKKVKDIKGDPKQISLEDAEIIVAIGRGLDSDNLLLIEEFAEVLGASIGGTRPAVDNGLIPFERQIGITGKTVEPKCLVACGVSGAREFLSGMEKTRFIIAINNDADAPIFSVANVGILGTICKVVPDLMIKMKDIVKTNEKEN